MTFSNGGLLPVGEGGAGCPATTGGSHSDQVWGVDRGDTANPGRGPTGQTGT